MSPLLHPDFELPGRSLGNWTIRIRKLCLPGEGSLSVLQDLRALGLSVGVENRLILETLHSRSPVVRSGNFIEILQNF